MAELAPGTQFGAYRIESVAGQGGMGVVYRATQLGLDRPVALKVITPAFAHDEEFRARFQRESKLAASIEHPNVIPVYEAGEQDGTLFLAMRYVDGTDLKTLLTREGRLEPIRAARFVAQIAAALDAAHAAGLVHRDVKPANALLASQDHVYLTDFGLTKRAASGSAMTKTGQMVGTVDYVAPEQVEGGSVDARTDVYSLACVYHHLLTGRVPFDKPTEMAKLFAHVHEDPPRPSEVVPGLPGAVDDVIWRGMSKDPSKRYLSAGDLGRAALAAAEHRALAEPERSVARGEAAPVPITAAPTVSAPLAEAAAPASERPATRPRNLKPWAIGAGAVVVIGVLVALLSGGGGGSTSSNDGANSAGARAPAASTKGIALTRAGAIATVSQWADYWTDENLGGLEEVFGGPGFKMIVTGPTCSDASQPMAIDAALAEFDCDFQKLGLPEVKATATTVDTAAKTASGTWALTDRGKAVSHGTFKMHFVPQPKDANPKLDKLELVEQ